MTDVPHSPTTLFPASLPSPPHVVKGILGLSPLVHESEECIFSFHTSGPTDELSEGKNNLGDGLLTSQGGR